MSGVPDIPIRAMVAFKLYDLVSFFTMGGIPCRLILTKAFSEHYPAYFAAETAVEFG
jgi:hypothetical protein